MHSERVKVLDHGFVRLIDSMGGDLSVVSAARVSYSESWKAGEDEGSDTRLIKYLKKNKHHTPFEAVTLKFEVKAPIFVFRQWHRHRTWCLAGNTRLRFIRPSDSKPYWRTIESVHDQWNSEPDVKRKDKQKRSLKDFKRERISSMKLSCIESGNLTYTRIVDCWYSGEKEVFEIENVDGDKIIASADHRFLTPDGWKKVKEIFIGQSIYGIKRISEIESISFRPYDLVEYLNEEWRSTEFKDIEISSLGRVKRKGRLVNPTVNKKNRAVVSIKSDDKWTVVQVSHLVAKTFLGKSDLHVLHNDDCSLNNRVVNLRYGTDLENHQDAAKNKRRCMNQVRPIMVKNITYAGVQKTYDVEVEHSDHNFIAENFCTHNSYNELSARYRELPEEYYVPALEQITPQSKSNKQGREFEGFSLAKKTNIQSAIDYTSAAAFESYRMMLARGLAKELARLVLPVNTYSHMEATVSLLNLMRFLSLRDHSHAQYEIRVYAEAMRELAKSVAPVCIAAWEEFGA